MTYIRWVPIKYFLHYIVLALLTCDLVEQVLCWSLQILLALLHISLRIARLYQGLF